MAVYTERWSVQLRVLCVCLYVCLVFEMCIAAEAMLVVQWWWYRDYIGATLYCVHYPIDDAPGKKSH